MEHNSTSEQKWYNKTWIVIILCIVFFPLGLYALWKNASLGVGWKIGVTAFIVLAVIASMTKQKNEDTSHSNTTPLSSETTAIETSTEIEIEKEEPKSIWTYTEDEDKMSGQKRYFGTCVSTNQIEFEFPYNGGSTFNLIIRNMGQGNEVILQVSNGQFITSISSSESCRVKFDDEQPSKFTYNSASDGSSDVIFINNAKKFISRLKKAQKLMIEVQFYNAGNQIIYFDVAGLEWDK